MSRGRIMRITEPILVMDAGSSWTSPEVGDVFEPESGYIGAFLDFVQGNDEEIRVVLQGSMDGSAYTNLSGPDTTTAKDPFTGANIAASLAQWVTLNGAPDGGGWSPVLAPFMRFRATVQSGSTNILSELKIWICEARFD